MGEELYGGNVNVLSIKAIEASPDRGAAVHNYRVLGLLFLRDGGLLEVGSDSVDGLAVSLGLFNLGNLLLGLLNVLHGSG